MCSDETDVGYLDRTVMTQQSLKEKQNVKSLPTDLLTTANQDLFNV